jgi:hypothetical protein
MKFTCSTEINLPLDKVIELYQKQDDLKLWHIGFVSKEVLAGLPNQTGTKSKIIYHNNNNVIELIETILPSKSKNEIIALYEHKHMINTMTSSFSAMTNNKTRLDLQIHYSKFIGFMPRLMAFLMPGVFKKQTQKMVDNFKIYAEKR